MNLEELRARQTEIRNRLQAIDSEHANRAMSAEFRTEWNDLNAELDRNEELIGEFETRAARLAEISNDPEARESGAEFHVPNVPAPGATRGDDIYDLTTVRSSFADPTQAAGELRERALRSVDSVRFGHRDVDEAEARSHVQHLIETVDTREGTLARRLLATGSPQYQRAFGGQLAGRLLTNEERTALAIGANANGQFAVPYTLDPTIIPTSNGAVNPFRRISRVEQIVGNTWKGITSAGITAGYAAEAAQASDNAPTIGQPELNVEKAHAFVPFSIEIDQDWSGMQGELATLLNDAKDELEATKFALGAGHGSIEPQGVIVGATTTLDTITATTFASGDVYALEADLPARFRPLAQLVANRIIYNKIRQFDSGGGAQLWKRIAEPLNNDRAGNTGAEVLGYPANEASAMSGSLAAGELIAVLGDFRHFLIVDRIGMNIELIPHLMGANNRPTGQRGLYAYWRNTSEVLTPLAFRTLKVKA